MDQINLPASQKPLRLWPGVVAVALQWLIRFGVPLVVPDAGGGAILGAIAFGLVVILWWLFFSRAPWAERVGAIVLMVGALFGTSLIAHESIAGGKMGMMLPIFSIPFLYFILHIFLHLRLSAFPDATIGVIHNLTGEYVAPADVMTRNIAIPDRPGSVPPSPEVPHSTPEDSGLLLPGAGFTRRRFVSMFSFQLP